MVSFICRQISTPHQHCLLTFYFSSKSKFTLATDIPILSFNQQLATNREPSKYSSAYSNGQPAAIAGQSSSVVTSTAAEVDYSTEHYAKEQGKPSIFEGACYFIITPKMGRAFVLQKGFM